jgi:sec-independent protein translocase protein TatA
MGFGSISITQLLIVLAIVILVFGTKRLKNLGGDLGGALKSFRKAMDTDEDKQPPADVDEAKQIEAEGEGEGEPDAEFSEQADKQKQK